MRSRMFVIPLPAAAARSKPAPSSCTLNTSSPSLESSSIMMRTPAPPCLAEETARGGRYRSPRNTQNREAQRPPLQRTGAGNADQEHDRDEQEGHAGDGACPVCQGPRHTGRQIERLEGVVRTRVLATGKDAAERKRGRAEDQRDPDQHCACHGGGGDLNRQAVLQPAGRNARKT